MATALRIADLATARGEPAALARRASREDAPERALDAWLAAVVRQQAPLRRVLMRLAARLVAGEKLPAWACMEAVAAEAVSALLFVVDPLAERALAEDVRGALARAERGCTDGGAAPAANVCPPPSGTDGGAAPAANVCPPPSGADGEAAPPRRPALSSSSSASAIRVRRSAATARGTSS